MKVKYRIFIGLIMLGLSFAKLNAQNGYYGDSNYPGKVAGILWAEDQKKKEEAEKKNKDEGYQNFKDMVKEEFAVLNELQKKYNTTVDNMEQTEKIEQYKEMIENQQNKINIMIKNYCKQQKENEKTTEEEQPDTVGDPVLILSKKYYLKDEDTFFKYGKNEFSFTRTFVSSDISNGALGKSWSCNIDTRIIRGMEKESKKEAEKLKKQIDILNDLYNETKKSKSASVAGDLLSKIENALAEREKNYDYYYEKEKISENNENLNTKVKYGTEYSLMEESGTDSILYVDEDNNKNYMKLNSQTKKYESLSKKNKDDFYIQSNNGNYENGFTVIYSDGKKKYYNKYGLPESFSDIYGKKIIFIYNENLNLIKITHNGNICLEFFWNSKNQLAEINNKIYNKIIKYEYDGNLLKSIVDSSNNQYGFEYDADGDLTHLIKPDDSMITIEYCKKRNSKTNKINKNVISTYSENFYQESYETNEDEKILNYTDADGNTTEYTIENDTKIIKEVYPDGTLLTRKFDENENIIETTNKFGTVSYKYDTNDNLILSSFDDGSSEQFDYNEKNKIKRYIDRDNIETNYNYDSYGNITEIIRDGKNIVNISYNEWGGLNKQSGIYGEYVYLYNEKYQPISDGTNFYEYNVNGQIAKVINQQGNIWTYTYSDDNKVINEKNPFGLIVKLKKNSRGDVINFVQIDTIENVTYSTFYEYDKSHNLKVVLKGKGISEEDAENNKEKIATYNYSPAGKLLSHIKWNLNAACVNDAPGVITEYSYNSIGKLSLELHSFVDDEGKKIGREYKQQYLYSYPNGLQEITIVDGNNKKTINYYTKNGTLLKSKDAENKSIKRVCSSGGKVLSEKNIFGGMIHYIYNNAVDKISTISTDKNGTEILLYNDEGKISYKKEVDGFETYYTYKNENGISEISAESTRGYTNQKYDSFGRLIENTKGNSKNDILYNQKFNYSKDNSSCVFTNENQEIIFKFDCFQNLIYSNSDNTYLKYNENGKVVREQKNVNGRTSTIDYSYNSENLISQITQSDGTVINFYYNPCNQLVKKTDNLGIIWQGEYDNAGNLISESGRLCPKKDYYYDDAGVLIQTKEAGCTTKKNKYSNNMKNLEVVDGNGNSYFSMYDDFGNLTKKINRLGNIMIIDKNFIENKTNVRNYDGKQLEVIIDRKNGTKKIKYEDGNEEMLEFDFAGGITSASNQSQIQKMKYNSMHELLSTKIDDKVIEFQYDEFGKKKSISTENLVNNYSFDNSGNIINATCNDYSMNFVYNEDGNEILSVDKSGSIIETEYDIIGRPILVTHKDSENKIIFAEGTLYNNDGRICCTTDLEGNITLYEYDEHGRIKSVKYPYFESYKDNAEKEFFECGKEIKSEVKLFTIEIPMEYLKELQNIWNKLNLANPEYSTEKVWTENYSYDKCGNRIIKVNPLGNLEYEYDAENRLIRILGSTPVTFEYDKNGNLINKNSVYESIILSYNNNDRLKESVLTDKKTKKSTTTYYEYDALGRRILENSNELYKKYFYNGLSFENLFTNYKIYTRSLSNSTDENSIRYRDVYNTVNGSNAKIISRQKNYVNVNGSLRFQVLENDSFSFCNDIRGSVRSVVNSSGGKVASVCYTSDGEPFINTSLSWSSPSELSLSFNNYFCGKEYNPSLKQYYFGFRDYSASLGRFTTVDPICDGENWYSYCNGDAVNFVDPLGLENLAPRILNDMQYYQNINLGNSNSSYIQSSGCYVNGGSGVVNTLQDTNYTAIDLNNDKSNFVKDSDLMNTESFSKNYGLIFKDYAKSKKSKVEMDYIIDSYDSSPEADVAMIKVDYTKDNKEFSGHWVCIEGKTYKIGNESYIKICGTSVNDRAENIKANRPDCWIESKGDVCVPVSEIEILRVFKKDKNSDFNSCTN